MIPRFVNRVLPTPERYRCRCGWKSAPRRSTPTCPICGRLAEHDLVIDLRPLRLVEMPPLHKRG